MISTVDMRDGVGVTELADVLGTTKGAVSQLVTRLVEKGMLMKVSDSENMARVVIRTTDLGHAASDNHMAFHRQHDQAFLHYLSGLDEASYAVVCQLGEQMNKWMENYLK